MEEWDKKKIANEKRLKAIKEWQQKRQNCAITSKGTLDQAVKTASNKIKHYNFDDEQTSVDNKFNLFGSEEEDEGESYKNCFKIRPQFEGKHGHRMLEMSSELSERFKLDERFKEDDDLIFEKDLADSEKNKNIRILESILGHEVSNKHSIAISSKRKKEIERFDPENEKNISCVRDVEKAPKKPRIKNRVSEPEISNNNKNNEEVPYSSERYIEVSSDLKDIMSSTSTFSFTEKFKSLGEMKDVSLDDVKGSADYHFVSENLVKENVKETALEKESGKYLNDFEGSRFKDSFFIPETDYRLKEGIEFFMRPKSLEEIRNEWLIKRAQVLYIFKNRRKSAQRSSTKQPKNLNQRNKIFSRNRNFTRNNK